MRRVEREDLQVEVLTSLMDRSEKRVMMREKEENVGIRSLKRGEEKGS